MVKRAFEQWFKYKRVSVALIVGEINISLFTGCDPLSRNLLEVVRTSRRGGAPSERRGNADRKKTAGYLKRYYPHNKGKQLSVLLAVRSVTRLRQGSWDSRLDLYLPMERLCLSFQVPKLRLDEISQGLPHFQLKGIFKGIICCNNTFFQR